MSKFEHSFEKVYEALITRYTAGCFSVGDVVKFDTKAIQKSDAYKGLTKSLKSRLDNMMRTSDAGESVIVVTDVTLGALDGWKKSEPATITLAYSHGGGRWVEPLTIPGSLTEFITAEEEGVNLVNKIPTVNRITHPVSTTAEEVDLKELEKNRTKGHAKSTIHGESFSPIPPKKERIVQFEIGKVYKATWGKHYKFKVVKRTESRVILELEDFDSYETTAFPKRISRKIRYINYPGRDANGKVEWYKVEVVKLSDYQGELYAE